MDNFTPFALLETTSSMTNTDTTLQIHDFPDSDLPLDMERSSGGFISYCTIAEIPERSLNPINISL